jgi:hypothetical protein
MQKKLIEGHLLNQNPDPDPTWSGSATLFISIGLADLNPEPDLIRFGKMTDSDLKSKKMIDSTDPNLYPGFLQINLNEALLP